MFRIVHERALWLDFIFAGLILCGFLTPISGADPTSNANENQFSADQLEFFEKEIRPILANRCYDCHGPETEEANLRLDSRPSVLKGGDTGPSIVPGHPKQSELIDAINYEAGGYQMPPDGKLQAEEIASLTRWVQEGAPWPAEEVEESATGDGFNLAERAKHWSFQPVKKVTPPAVTDTNWPLQSLDHFILRELEKSEIAPAPPADSEVWLRRVTFDLTGLPPTIEERDDFLNDNSETAYEKVVDRLLASDQYGVRWGRHWLDLMRFAESYGHEFDYDIYHAWRYRDYVVNAFNQDLPYDQFIKEHVAGDLFENPRRSATGQNESVQATAFYWLGQGKHSPVDIRSEECDLVDNQIDVLTKSFLGLTVSCARCHDHKFDPITTKDYYALAGYLQSSRSDWTIINDTPAVQETLHQLDELTTTGHQKVSQRILSELALQLESDNTLLNRLKEGLFAQESISSEAHPFHLWKEIASNEDSARRREILGQADTSIKEDAKFREQAVSFATFTPAESADWFLRHFVKEERFSQSGELSLSALGDGKWEFITGGALHTGQLGKQMQGSYRSPTFEVEHNFIHYRIRKQGGEPTQTRGYKQGPVNLVVDGLILIKNPLYGSLSLALPIDGSTVWLSQQVDRAIGHRAYIEILDEDDGDIVVEKILFSNNPNPPLILTNEAVSSTLFDMVPIDVDDPIDVDAACFNLIKNITSRAANDLRGLNPAEIELLNNVLSVAVPLFNEEVQHSIDRFQLAVEQLQKQIPKPEKITAITAGTPENEYVLIRGNHEKLGEPVPRRFLEALDPDAAKSGTNSNRLKLADKIASPENPLTARVIVNRLWLHHFGRGIVASPDNFGILGEAPSHPDLLDFLATELVQQKWSLKAIHRQMVLSQTYRMASELADAHAEEQDPANLLWHRMPIRRLEAEAIRDSVLSVSGQLDLKLGGLSVSPHLTDFMEGRGRPSQSGPLDGDRRRSIYLMVRRNFLNPMFLAFDFPTPHTTMGRRSVSNVPAQALTMMNNPFVVVQAKLWAESILENESASDSDKDRIVRMYLQAFGREPKQEEVDLGVTFLEQQRQEYTGDPESDLKSWSDYAHVLFNVKDFIYLN
ncbi:Planctomycete cytochrome C [Polystyrenella longa]|uniref:Planctomycete cytochrome C n=1 Tax=Polystyrenella longa TaxID=2528007 RepID=A0A518CRB7_9PLAN|nr:PSD1 and planctomycete cytochrome C domain-containing protein [Polystyrenella longa]QDU81771.1 Planctomycete cytochrome C [Polystyrenella longa]